MTQSPGKSVECVSKQKTLMCMDTPLCPGGISNSDWVCQHGRFVVILGHLQYNCSHNKHDHALTMDVVLGWIFFGIVATYLRAFSGVLATILLINTRSTCLTVCGVDLNRGVSPEKLFQNCKRISRTFFERMLSPCQRHTRTVKGLQPCLTCLDNYRSVGPMVWRWICGYVRRHG